MRLIDADVLDRVLLVAQAECKRNGGNFRYGVLSAVRENLRGDTDHRRYPGGVDYIVVKQAVSGDTKRCFNRRCA